MLKSLSGKIRMASGALAVALFAFAFAPEAQAQRRLPDFGDIADVGRVADAVGVQIKVGEITLEEIDFRNQTARLNLGLDVANGLVPVSLKDFDYRLRLGGRDLIEGAHNGTLRVGGRKASRVNMPVTVHLRSIPNVVWSAFSNRGRLRYELDSAFTLPLFVTERRFDQSVSGEVPLRSIVGAASIIRARNMSGSRSSATDRIRDSLPW